MGKKALRSRFLFNSRSGTLEENREVIISDNIIESVGEIGTTPLSDEIEIIDLGAATLLPGLADCHVHYGLNGETSFELPMLKELIPFQAIRAAGYARKDLEAGFTMIRAVGDKGFLDVALRQAIKAGFIEGPRLSVSGHMLAVTGGRDAFAPGVSFDENLFTVCDGPDGVAKAAREQLKYGADWIKLGVTGAITAGDGLPGAQQFTEEEMKSAVACARLYGKKVSGHAHGAEGIKAAVRSGIDSIEHACLADEESLLMMADAGTYWVPTLSPVHLIVLHGIEKGIPPQIVERSKAVNEHHMKVFARAFELGVRIVMGTDVGMPFNPHGGNALELELMGKAGMPSVEVLRSATINAAEMLGWTGKTGEVAKGCYADIIGVRGNPLEDLSLLQSPSFVMKDGIIYKNR